MFSDCPGCTPPIVRTLSLLVTTIIIVMIIAFEALSPTTLVKIKEDTPAENVEYDDSGDSAQAKALPKKAETKRDWKTSEERAAAFDELWKADSEWWNYEIRVRGCMRAIFIGDQLETYESAHDRCLAHYR